MNLKNMLALGSASLAFVMNTHTADAQLYVVEPQGKCTSGTFKYNVNLTSSIVTATDDNTVQVLSQGDRFQITNIDIRRAYRYGAIGKNKDKKELEGHPLLGITNEPNLLVPHKDINPGQLMVVLQNSHGVPVPKSTGIVGFLKDQTVQTGPVGGILAFSHNMPESQHQQTELQKIYGENGETVLTVQVLCAKDKVIDPNAGMKKAAGSNDGRAPQRQQPGGPK